jgi:hypothetical protein
MPVDRVPAVDGQMAGVCYGLLSCGDEDVPFFLEVEVQRLVEFIIVEYKVLHVDLDASLHRDTFNPVSSDLRRQFVKGHGADAGNVGRNLKIIGDKKEIRCTVLFPIPVEDVKILLQTYEDAFFDIAAA